MTTTRVARIITAISTSATVSLVRCDRIAAVGAPVSSPIAQAKLSTTVASAISTPIRSAVSVTAEIDGRTKANDGPPSTATVSIATTTADDGNGSAATSSAVTSSPAHVGSLAPRRSTIRPIAGELTVANSDAITNVTPIATPEAPSCDRRNGSSVPVAPTISASSRNSHRQRST